MGLVVWLILDTDSLAMVLLVFVSSRHSYYNVLHVGPDLEALAGLNALKVCS